LTLALCIFLGLIFGTSLGYLAVGALRATRSTNDEAAPVDAANTPNQSLGNGWEHLYSASREHPNIPD
jgi:hypothetical protein